MSTLLDTDSSNKSNNDSGRELYSALVNHSSDSNIVKRMAEMCLQVNTDRTMLRQELVGLILRACGMSECSLNDDDLVTHVYELINEKYDELESADIKSYNPNFLPGLFTFFEHLFTVNSGLLADSVLPKILEALSVHEIISLRYCCFAIRLKYVTGFLKSAECNDRNRQQFVQKLAEKLMKEAYLHVYSANTVLALTEFQKWFQCNEDLFATEMCFRSVLVCTHFSNNTVFTAALQTTLVLLSSTSTCIETIENLCKFANQLSAAFAKKISIKNMKTFELLYENCVKIRPFLDHNEEEQLSRVMLCEMFSETRKRAQIASAFWMKCVLANTKPEQKLRKIIDFMRESGSKESTYMILVDTLIDQCNVLSNWSLYVKILTSDRRYRQFTLQEKEQIVTLMSFSIYQTITGIRPKIRGAALGEAEQCPRTKQNREKISKIILPNFLEILGVNYPNKYKTMALLFRIATHLEFRLMPLSDVQKLIIMCTNMFKAHMYIPLLETSLDLIRVVGNTCSELEEQTITILGKLKGECESKFELLAKDVVANPEKYTNNTTAQQFANTVFTQIFAFNIICHLKETCVLNIPRRFLEHTHLPNTTIHLMLMEVCMYLYTDYIIGKIRSIAQLQQTSVFSADALKSEISTIDSYLEVVESKFSMLYGKRYGELFFFGVCKVLENLSHIDVSGNKPRKAVIELIVTYVGVTLCGFQSDSLNITLSNSVKFEILKTFLNLLLRGIIPLICGYDVLCAFLQFPIDMREMMKHFVRSICAKEDEGKMISMWLARLLYIESESNPDFVSFVQQLLTLFLPPEEPTQAMLEGLHKLGISFFIAKASETELPVRFIKGLSELSAVLQAKVKKTVLKYALDKLELKTIGGAVVTEYLQSLKKPTNWRKFVLATEGDSDVSGDEFDEDVGDLDSNHTVMNASSVSNKPGGSGKRQSESSSEKKRRASNEIAEAVDRGQKRLSFGRREFEINDIISSRSSNSSRISIDSV